MIAQFLFLESEDPDKDIQLYINSPGGSVTAGLAIYDTMQFIKSGLDLCIGQAASMGAVLLTAGQRESVCAAECADHDPSAARRRQGQATDIEIQAREILRCVRAQRYPVHHTGQQIDKIEKDTERDYFMSAEQAKEYGLIDEVIVRRGSSK